MFQMQVSLKVIKQSVTKNISDRFLECMSSIQRMNHPQLIRMYGVVVDVHDTIVVSSSIIYLFVRRTCILLGTFMYRSDSSRTHFEIMSNMQISRNEVLLCVLISTLLTN